VPERATVLSRSEKSAKVEVGRLGDRRTEREGVFTGMAMRRAQRQMSDSAERSGAGQGESLSDPGSDEAVRDMKRRARGQGCREQHWQERTCNRLGNGCGPTRVQRESTGWISTRPPTGCAADGP
jgi:hypothetical protein